MAYYTINLTGAEIAKRLNAVPDKQNQLHSGENIKTINGKSILGEGDLPLNFYTKGETNVLLSQKQNKLNSSNLKTINNQSLLGSGNIVIESGGDLSNYYTKDEVDDLIDPSNFSERTELDYFIGVDPRDRYTFAKIPTGVPPLTALMGMNENNAIATQNISDSDTINQILGFTSSGDLVKSNIINGNLKIDGELIVDGSPIHATAKIRDTKPYWSGIAFLPEYYTSGVTWERKLTYNAKSPYSALRWADFCASIGIAADVYDSIIVGIAYGDPFASSLYDCNFYLVHSTTISGSSLYALIDPNINVRRAVNFVHSSGVYLWNSAESTVMRGTTIYINTIPPLIRIGCTKTDLYNGSSAYTVTLDSHYTVASDFDVIYVFLHYANTGQQSRCIIDASWMNNVSNSYSYNLHENVITLTYNPDNHQLTNVNSNCMIYKVFGVKF